MMKQVKMQIFLIIHYFNEWCINKDIFTWTFAVKTLEEFVVIALFYFWIAKILINILESLMNVEMRSFFREMLFNVINLHKLYAEKLKITTRELGYTHNIFEKILIEEVKLIYF